MDAKAKVLKKSIINTINSIKQKYRKLHDDRLTEEENLKIRYKPITTSINKLKSKLTGKTNGGLKTVKDEYKNEAFDVEYDDENSNDKYYTTNSKEIMQL